MKNKILLNKLYFLGVMVLFGCMGPFVRGTGLPAGLGACLRAWIGLLCLVLFLVIKRYKFNWAELKKTIIPMVVSGIFLAADWIGLFLAYQYTTLATATVVYYIVPILVLFGSFIILKEKFTIRHLICAIIAFGGIVLVSGVITDGFDLNNLIGPIFAFVGAVSYAGVVITNKKYPSGDPIMRTVVQIGVVAIVSIPYALVTTDFAEVTFTPWSICCLLILGVVITAANYLFYFSLIVKIPARTTAFFSYIDPITAVILSVFVMSEPMNVLSIIGTVLVIGSAIVSEI